MDIKEFARWQRERIEGDRVPCNMDKRLDCFPLDDDPVCRECWTKIQEAGL